MANILCAVILFGLCAAAVVQCELRHMNFGYYQPQTYYNYYRPQPPIRVGVTFNLLGQLPYTFYNNYVCNTLAVNRYTPSYGSYLSNAYYYIFRGKRDLSYLSSLSTHYSVVSRAYSSLTPYWDTDERMQLLNDVMRVSRAISADKTQELTVANVLKQVIQKALVSSQEPGNVQNILDSITKLKTAGFDEIRRSVTSVIKQSCGYISSQFYCNYLERLSRVQSCSSKYFTNLLLKQCCQSSVVNPPVDPPTPVAITTTATTTTTTTTAATPAQRCGVSTKNPATRFADFSAVLSQLRIVGGVNAEICEYPWMVRLQAGNNLCGGTIIDATHVMTAGHCIGSLTASDMSVNVGEYKYNVQEPQDQKVGVSAIALHPDYKEVSAGSVENDIAILTLDQPLTFSDCVQPVCLPESGDSAALSNAQCIATGWGTTSYGGSTSPVLQEVSMPTYNGAQCNTQFPNIKPTDPNVQICAGRASGGADSCQGDSGGPLFCPVDGKYVQYGIVSYGDGCGKAGSAGVYTDVSAMTSFINSVIQ